MELKINLLFTILADLVVSNSENVELPNTRNEPKGLRVIRHFDLKGNQTGASSCTLGLDLFRFGF